jgi:hypothetical protein
MNIYSPFAEPGQGRLAVTWRAQIIEARALFGGPAMATTSLGRADPLLDPKAKSDDSGGMSIDGGQTDSFYPR